MDRRIHWLAEEQGLLTRRVVWHEEHRRLVKAVDQEAGFVVEAQLTGPRRVVRPRERMNALSAER